MELRTCTAVLAHGAGSSADFLRAAFPPERLGMRSCHWLEDRTGSLSEVAEQIASACARLSGPVVVGGVSLGAHAAAALLADHPPANVVAGIVCMPAWTGPAERVAGLTAAAADVLAVLGPEAVLAELDATDWVTPQLASAWQLRADHDLVAEMRLAAEQAAPTTSALGRITVPVSVVALADDPLHPKAVAAAWVKAIPRARMVTVARIAPADDLAVFADAAAAGLRAATCG